MEKFIDENGIDVTIVVTEIWKEDISLNLTQKLTQFIFSQL